MIAAFLNSISYIDGVYVAGGAIRDMYYGKAVPNDIDIFCRDDAAKLKVWVWLNNHGWFGTCTKQVMRFEHEREPPVHLITHKYYASVWDVLKGFDLVGCQFGWTPATGIVHTEGAPKATTAKALVLNTVDMPVAMLRHIEKYIGYGYTGDNNFWTGVVKGIQDYKGELDIKGYHEKS